LLRKFAHLLLRLGGWTPVGGVLDDPKAVLVAAPHTSNWDGYWALVYKVAVGLDVRFFAKKSLFWFPLGNLLRWLGAIELDRSRAVNAVQLAIDEFEKNDSFYLGLAPEGTRSLKPFLDFGQKRIGIGPKVELTGDPDVDLAVIRKHYEGIKGRWPEKASPIVFP